ncbi:MAG TPA: NAD-dependent succinate-semialdehyde dehydrogenase [Rhodothermales bacterium]|nr:NAD-dependent succinate-semialdehyde dehydrogenase [Rhodothermales bacterium]
MPFISINPATEIVRKSYPTLTSSELEQKLQRADHAFPSYAQTTLVQRANWLIRAAELLEERAEYLGQIMTEEMGKPLVAAIAEAKKCASVCRYYAENGDRFLKPVTIASDASHSYVAYSPLGAILGIMPWNFPLWQAFRACVPTMMAGNVFLLKHAPNTPESAYEMEKLMLDAGFPEGTFQNLFVEVEAVAGIIQDPRVAAVTLTGSVGAGRSVARLAGEALKKTVLELGGSDPFIVLEDADLELAAEVAVSSRYLNSGQTCIAAKRFIMVASVAEAFTEKFLERVKALKVGNPVQPDVTIGPMARADLRQQLHDQVVRSVAAGAKILCGGSMPTGTGFFYEPTVLGNVQPGMAAFDEELFGPVAALVVAKDEADALYLANRSDYGLGATVFTNDLPRAESLGAKINAGCVFINGMVKSDPRLPFGGIKHSGYGRELSEMGIHEFVNAKTVWVR